MKVVIFDLDGVCIKDKDEQGKFLWSKNIEKDLGITSTHMQHLFSKDWHAPLKGLMDTRQYFSSIFAKLHIDLSVHTFIDYWLEHDWNINTDVFGELQTIKNRALLCPQKRSNITLCLGTNQDTYRAHFIRTKIGTLFDALFFSCDLGAMKPETEFYKHIESKLGVEPHHIAFIDDSKAHVEAATRAGWISHQYQNIDDLKNFLGEL